MKTSEELIQWTPASKLPDSDETVIVYTPSSDSEPVWLGYHDGEQWCDISGAALDDVEVLFWARMPAGPNSAAPLPPQEQDAEAVSDCPPSPDVTSQQHRKPKQVSAALV